MRPDLGALEDKYEIGELLGRGAHGAVYHARHKTMARDVAIKVVTPRHGETPQSKFLRRFEQEARVISKLTSSATVHVHDYGASDSAYYLVMEYIDGETLDAHLSRCGALDPERAVKIAIQILDGLEEAHMLTVLHRDLKPSNIMLTRDFREREVIKVLDFGVAKIMFDVAANEDPDDILDQAGLHPHFQPHDDTLTHENAFIGTPRYAAPEQFNQAPVSPATDLWAVGAILWEMLTGAPLNPHLQLFDCVTFHVRHASAPPAFPAHEQIPSQIVDVLMRAIQPDATNRWLDAASMRAALEDALRFVPQTEERPLPSDGREPPEHARPKPRTLEEEPGFQHLLQGKDAWWHFMAAKGQGALTPELDNDEVELELESVGRIAQREKIDERPKFQPHHTSSLRCDVCGAEIPADMTFCVYCAAAPNFRAAARGQLLVIEAIEDADILIEVAELLQSSNDALDLEEIRDALEQPPGVFFFPARDEYARALVWRLEELGVRSSISHRDESGLVIVREAAESISRSLPAMLSWISIFALTALALILSVPAIAVVPACLIACVALAIYHGKRFSTRYELDVGRMLDAMTGMTPEITERAIKGLRLLGDKEVKQLLTLCLIEYYAIWRQLSAAPLSMRPLLGGLRENLMELINQILDACIRYGELHAFAATNDLEAMRSELSRLDEQLLTTKDAAARKILHRQLEQRHKQLTTASEVSASLAPVRERLRAMCASLETLRARVVAMTLAKQSTRHDETLVQQIILELDDEMAIFEDALAEVHVST